MKRKTNEKAPERRNFLRAAGTVSTLAVAALASPLMARKAEAYNPGKEETKARYRVTPDVKAFYRTNRY